jgi:hypothetical protein
LLPILPLPGTHQQRPKQTEKQAALAPITIPANVVTNKRATTIGWAYYRSIPLERVLSPRLLPPYLLKSDRHYLIINATHTA